MNIPDKPYKSNQAKLSDDPYLSGFRASIDRRKELLQLREIQLTQGQNLLDYANGYNYYGLHKVKNRWIFREWAPNATAIFMVGDFSDWQQLPEYELKPINSTGDWELELPSDALCHKMQYKLLVYWDGGNGYRLPAYCTRATQDPQTHVFSAEIWEPEEKYTFKYKRPSTEEGIFIYEAHVGMASEDETVADYKHFTDHVLPYVAECGYNTVQLMAIMEHPYYGSFGYHVSNFFAVSSRFGTPDDFKKLVDKAHSLGLRVIMDIVHSHSIKNENEGLGKLDGTNYQYFHAGQRGNHWLWDSYCFDYGKPNVLHFLLSNCKFWLEQYNIDGFRFDGITSMLYYHHGLGKAFTSYNDYFGGDVDEDAYCYLAIANKLIHQLRPDGITIAEDVSGMPGLCSPQNEGGAGFDFRMAMGVTDCWFKMMDKPDENWDINIIAGELLNKRKDEKTISYLECHDQALVGGKSAIFTLIDKEMYYNMHKESISLAVDRGIALHKILRLATIFTAGNGYLNFMGNEFGHPEWIDFPREGNNWSYKFARRIWSLKDNTKLRYSQLVDFDKIAVTTIRNAELYSYNPMLLIANNPDKIFAVKRGEYYLFTNLHPSTSYEGYGFEVLPGEYKIMVNTDDGDFGGFSRIENKVYKTEAMQEGDTVKNYLKLYLPARTAIVLKRV